MKTQTPFPPRASRRLRRRRIALRWPSAPLFLRPRSVAFTFLELVVVITIIGLLIAAGVPHMQKSQRKSELRMAARNIVSVLKYARAEAVSRRQRVEVRFDLKEHLFRMDLLIDGIPASMREEQELRVDSEEEIHRLPRTKDLKRVAISKIYTFDQVTQINDEEGQPTIVALRFYPRGTATGAIIVLQTLRNKKDKEEYMTVELFRTTGIVEVYEGRPADDNEEMREEDGG